MIVGLTGGIGAGKSSAKEFFQELGVPTISADEISKELVEPGEPALASIVKKFGKTILNPEGDLNRGKLRAKIFKDKSAQQWLENLLHPLIKLEIAKRCQQISYPYVIVEIPLLIEAKMKTSVDRILIIDCSEALQISRASQRDEVSDDSIAEIMATQVSRQDRLDVGDDVIINNGSLLELQQAVEQQHQHYLALAATNHS